MTVPASTLKRLFPIIGITILVSFLFSSLTVAQDVSLTESVSHVNACRRIIRTAEVFDNSSLGPSQNRVGTLNVGEQVTLTGVLASGRAQVYRPNSDGSIQVLGWVDAARLSGCNVVSDRIGQGDAVCYRVNTALNVRTSPSTAASILGDYIVGDIAYATADPQREVVDNGRVWLQVYVFDNNVGWIARTNADGSRNNVTLLPSNQCGR